MKVTVFTPTYNRAPLIHNLYESLKRQICKEFEWLVIDDGSTDNTQELFEKWMQEENSFLIRYYKQANGGKCRAINRALDFAMGELFFTVDSDDFLTDDAILKIISWEKELPKDQKFCGVAGNLGISEQNTPNYFFEKPFYDGTLLDRYRNVDGERALAFYTSIHRQYRYPEFDGENFMTEAVAWNRIANAGYRMRFYNDIIWIYEYQEDGLTKSGNSIFLNNPKGYGLFLREKASFLQYSLFSRLRMFYTFTCDLYNHNESQAFFIADSIGAPRQLIWLFVAMRRIITPFKR